MQSRNQQLCRDKEQNHGCDPEEFLQIDSYAALYEHHTKQHRRKYARKRPDKVDQGARFERHRRENQNRLRALAQHHQKNEQKNAELRTAASQRSQLPFNLAFEFLAGPHHEDNHADHEECGGEHHPAFK